MTHSENINGISALVSECLEDIAFYGVGTRRHGTCLRDVKLFNYVLIRITGTKAYMVRTLTTVLFKYMTAVLSNNKPQQEDNH